MSTGERGHAIFNRLLAILLCCFITPSLALDCTSYEDYLHLVADLNLGGDGSQVVARDGYAYLAALGGHLKILDLSDPHAPTVAATVGSNWTNTVSLQDDIAYLTYTHDPEYPYYRAGLEIVDISDPEAPVSLSTLETYPTYLFGSFPLGDVLYVAAGDGLRIYDVSDPEAPFLVETDADISLFFDIDLNGDYATFSQGHFGLKVVDVSDPLDPVEVATLPTDMHSRGIDRSGTLMVVAESWGTSESRLRIVDVSDPFDPILATEFDIPGHATDVCIVQNTAHVAATSGDVQVVGLADPMNPVLLGRISVSDWAQSLALHGDYLCIAQHNDSWGATSHNFSIAAVQNPSFVPMISSEIGGEVESMALSGDLAFLAAGADGLRVVDIDQLDSPVELAQLPLPGHAEDIAVWGNYAYLACDEGGLQVVDVSLPSAPFVEGSLLIDEDARCLDFHGDHVYIGTYSGDLVVVRVADPSMPEEVGRISNYGGILDLTIHGDAAYLAREDNGILIADLSDPENPVQVGIYQSSFPFKRYVAVSGDLLIYAEDMCGYDDVIYSAVVFNDISDPFDPVELGEYWLPGCNVSALVATASTAYVTSGSLHVVSFEDPQSPKLLGALPHYPRALAAGFDFLAMAGFSEAPPDLLAFAPLECEDPTGSPHDWTPSAPDRLVSYPNPFNPGTTVAFDLPSLGPIRLSIHGLDGRLLRVLADRSMSAGRHEVYWDGRDESGHGLASGVYLLNLSTSDFQTREKLVLLK